MLQKKPLNVRVLIKNKPGVSARPNENFLTLLVDELNKKINTYHSFEDREAIEAEEKERNAIYEMIGDENDYYWDHLKKAQRIRGYFKDYDAKAKRDAYQLALSSDSIKNDLNKLHGKEASDRLLLQAISTTEPNNSSLLALNKLHQEFKDLHIRRSSVLASTLNRELALLLSIAENYDAIIRCLNKHKQRIHYNEKEITSESLIKKLKSRKIKIVAIWIQKANSLIASMDDIGRYGHADKLHGLLNELRRKYPNAAIAPNFSVDNAFNPEEVRNVYLNFIKMKERGESLATKKQQKQINLLDQEVMSMPWLNWELPELKNGKEKFDFETTEIGELVANVPIMNAVNQGARIVQELNQSENRETIRIYRSRAKKERTVGAEEPSQSLQYLPKSGVGSSEAANLTEAVQAMEGKYLSTAIQSPYLANPTAYFHALEMNYLALQAHEQLTKAMGWDGWFSRQTIDRIFSPKKFKSYETIKEVLVQQQKALDAYSQHYLETDVVQEISDVFAKAKNLRDAISYFVEMGKQWDLMARRSQVNLKLETRQWVSSYRKPLIKKLIEFIIENPAISSKDLKLLSTPKEFITSLDLQILEKLIKHRNEWKVLDKDKIDVFLINKFLNLHANDLKLNHNHKVTVENIKVQNAELYFQQKSQNSQFSDRVFDVTKLVYLATYAKEPLLNWITDNIIMCQVNDVHDMQIIDLINYAQFLQFTLEASKHYPTLDKESLKIVPKRKNEISQRIGLLIKDAKDSTDFEKYYKIGIELDKMSETNNEKPVGQALMDTPRVTLKLDADTKNSKVMLGFKFIELLAAGTAQKSSNAGGITSTLKSHSYFGELNRVIEHIYDSTIDNNSASQLLENNNDHWQEINFIIDKIKSNHLSWPEGREDKIKKNIYMLLKEMINREFVLIKNNADYIESILCEWVIKQVIAEKNYLNPINLISNLSKYNINLDEQGLFKFLSAAYSNAADNPQPQAAEDRLNTLEALEMFFKGIQKLGYFEKLNLPRQSSLIDDPYENSDVPAKGVLTSPSPRCSTEEKLRASAPKSVDSNDLNETSRRGETWGFFKSFKKSERENRVGEIAKLTTPDAYILAVFDFVNHLIASNRLKRISSLKQLQVLFANFIENFKPDEKINKIVATISTALDTIANALTKHNRDIDLKLKILKTNEKLFKTELKNLMDAITGASPTYYDHNSLSSEDSFSMDFK